MVSTRQRKRPSEVFQQLPSPKRQRKPRKPRSYSISPDLEPVTHAVASKSPFAEIYGPVSNTLAHSRSVQTQVQPEDPKFTYANASTQTDENIVVLTRVELALLSDKAATPKRTRDEMDDSREDERAAKRQLFTPQGKASSNPLWMFGGMESAAGARTAPARGRISRRPLGLAQKNIIARSHSRKVSYERIPPPIKPIEPETAPIRNVTSPTDREEVDEENSEPQASPSEADSPGWFGSIGRLASMPFNLFTPRKATSKRAEHSYTHSPSNAKHPAPKEGVHSKDDLADDLPPYRKFTLKNFRIAHDEPPQPSSRYDHLHQVKDGDPLHTGHLAAEQTPPPRAPTPPDLFTSLKSNNPDLADGMIRALVSKRQRRAARDEQEFGIAQMEKPPTCAPLFGPDSHYARGTVDTRLLSRIPVAMIPTEPDFFTSENTKKRKIDQVNNHAPQSKGFGISAAELETEDEDEEHEGLANGDGPETPLTKKQKTVSTTTPRSALKHIGTPGRSYNKLGGRSVLFNDNPISGSRDLRAHYGPAGQYKGSTFADTRSPASSDGTASTLHSNDWQSPSTKRNTKLNMGGTGSLDSRIAMEQNWASELPEIDFTVRDPNDPDWRPSPGRPAPGSFRAPNFDDDDDDSDDDESVEKIGDATPTQASATTIEQPSTPRISHATLPASPAPSMASSMASSINPDSILHESTELAVEKARSQARKYQPRNSSRLAAVSQAQSRSPSPEHRDLDEAEAEDDVTDITITAPAVQSPNAPAQPVVEPDNTIKGDDGMTAYEREHQYDNWAANEINWGAPQTYEEAGTGSQYIHDLVRKNWNAEDDQRSEAFWTEKFETWGKAQKDARAQGREFEFVTGMEDEEEVLQE